MLKRTVPHVLAVAMLAAYSSAVLAYRYQITDRICIPDAGFPPIERRIPIPVGCKLVDCCPGCPASGPLEWRIRIDARILQGAELRFEGMGAAELKKLKITGNAKVDGDRILVRRGHSRIQGVPDRMGANIGVGSLLPVASKDAGSRVRSLSWGSPARRGDRPRGSLIDQITVQQYLGPFPVNDFSWRYNFTRCPVSKGPFRVPWDTLKLQDHVPAESVAVMIDARTAAGATGCQDGSGGNEWVFGATPGPTGSIVLPNNLLRAEGCNSEIVVFSQDRKMYFERNVSTWTNSTGDVHLAPLEPAIRVPLTVWIADSAAAERAVEEVNNANLLYRQNRVGIQFDPNYENKSTDPAAVAIIDNGIGIISSTGRKECLDLQGLKDNGLYTDKALNFYYVRLEMYGRNCAIKRTPTTPCPSAGAEKGDGNITYIGSLVNLVSVAHEVGHALGLRPGPCGGHPDGMTGFDDDNIMLGEAHDLANHLTIGQVFRMNTHDDEWGGTMLIENGLRPISDRRACMPNSPANMLCPLLRTDLP